MKNKVRLTQDMIEEMVMRTVKNIIKEDIYDGFDDDGQSSANVSAHDPMFNDDEPAGFEGMERDGSLDEITAGRFQDEEDLDIWLSELGRIIDMEDEIDAVRERIKATYGYEDEMTGW